MCKRVHKNAYLARRNWQVYKNCPKGVVGFYERGSSSEREHDFSFFYFCSGFVFTLFHVRLWHND